MGSEYVVPLSDGHSGLCGVNVFEEAGGLEYVVEGIVWLIERVVTGDDTPSDAVCVEDVWICEEPVMPVLFEVGRARDVEIVLELKT